MRVFCIFLLLVRVALASPIALNQAVLGPKKARIAHPEVPSVYAIHLPEEAPQAPLVAHGPLSPGLTDPQIEQARESKAYPDFKPLSDARPRDGGTGRSLEEKYRFDDELLPAAIPLGHASLIGGDATTRSAFAYTEKLWPMLVRRTPLHSEGSLLVSPYPVLIAAPGRFHESYYWDTYFGLKGLLLTGRIVLAQGMTENFLHAVQEYGLVPNGMRDYYLSRSQPPFLSSLVREVWEASVRAEPQRRTELLRWLRLRGYPLVKVDYERFWMDPKTRYDEASGLNHHWDDLDLPRPERHGSDDERNLGKTFRDVRAEAESGLDFTVAFAGEASRVAGVLLNSLLYKTEQDLAWMAETLALPQEKAGFVKAAEHRQVAMNKLLWNEQAGYYENYHLGKGERIPCLSATTFAPLFVGEASPEQAKRVRAALPRLERAGGLMASADLQSTKQWDGTNGWAPLQVMAFAGLQRYGFTADAKRLAGKWTSMIAGIHSRGKVMVERMDVAARDVPGADGTKYPTQAGFLWTNASFVWSLVEVLGYKVRAGR